MNVCQGQCVSVVILNWNGWEDTLSCLESVTSQTPSPCTVVVVDNGSTDQSVPCIVDWAHAWVSRATSQRAFATRAVLGVASGHGVPTESGGQDRCDQLTSVVLLQIPDNRGFARGNNVGIQFVLNATKSRYVLVLNNDAALQEDALPLLVSALEGEPDAGLAGPRLLDANDGSEWQWPVKNRLSFDTVLIVFTGLNRLFRGTRIYLAKFERSSKQVPVYAIPGSCMLFTRKAIEDIQHFDPATFLYWEEFIVAEKLLAHGYLTLYVPACRVVHKLGASTRKLGARKFVENMRSETYFFSKYGKFSAHQILVLSMVRVVAYLGRCLSSSDYRSIRRDFVAVLFKRTLVMDAGLAPVSFGPPGTGERPPPTRQAS
jgi:GT2 family glycosyltransferase